MLVIEVTGCSPTTTKLWVTTTSPPVGLLFSKPPRRLVVETMNSLKFNTPEITDGSLLISGTGTDTGGGICCLCDGKLEVLDRISTGGLTFFESRLARLLCAPINAGGEILIYDDRGVSQYLRIDELSDPHYMLWDGKHLVISSTGTNSLIWLALDGSVVRRLRFPGEHDSWHLNDLHVADGRLYACAFGRYAHYRDYKDHLSKANGFVFDLISGDSVITGLCAPHSPRYFDAAWTVCDSLRNSVVQVDGQGRRQREVKLRSFTRGLAVTDDYLVVGESVQRVDEDSSATGSVAVVRRCDFGFVTRVEVPYREVSDIIVVPRSMVNGARIGFRTNSVRIKESDQLQMFRDVGIEPKRLWAVNERLAPEMCKVRLNARIPTTLICGSLSPFECTVQNLSDAFLSSELPFPVYLSCKWRNLHGPTPAAFAEGDRTRLPCMLPPGSSIPCRIELIAPSVEGEFEIVITLVQEHVLWFDAVDPSNAWRATVKLLHERFS